MDTLCTVENVHKRYGPHVVLKALNLTLAAGDMIAIVGPSGAGKTTVLNILGLLEPPDMGHITLFGMTNPHVNSRQAHRLRRTHLTYLFQNYGLIDNATAADNLHVSLFTQRGTRSEKKRRMQAALAQVGLEIPLTQKVYTLSGGEQQRVAIARAFAGQPRILFADEPTGNLDFQNAKTVADLLFELNETHGTTLILATHDRELASRCTHQRLLTEGTLQSNPELP